MKIEALYCMELAINLLANRDVNPDATLLGTLDQDAVLHFNRVMRHMLSTKDSTDGVDLTKPPNKMQPNTSAFKNWCTTIEEESDHKTSAAGIYPLGYFIRSSKTPVD